MTIAMLLLAWGWPALPATVASPRAQTSSGGAAPAYQFMLDADTCLAPQQGFFTPTTFGAYNVLVRELLLAETADDTVLSVVVQPSFASPYSLRLEQPRPSERAPDAARPYHLRLVRTKGHPWSEMMDEMHRLQGNVIHLGDAEQKRALSGTSHKTEAKMTPIAASLASRLTAAWAGALARTQVVTEIRKTADGHHIVTETLDGTTYDFWHDGRSGTTISPEERSLLGELTGIVETLARYADAAPSARPAVEKKLDAQLEAFQRRLKRNEPCLRAEWPRKAD